MPESGDLLSLLETLGKTHSPSSKLRLLGSSWKLLRDLTPKQRQRLFAAQGLKQAGDLLRRLGGREERSRDLLLALADQVEKGDVDKLGTIFNRVRSGGLSESTNHRLRSSQRSLRPSMNHRKLKPVGEKLPSWKNSRPGQGCSTASGWFETAWLNSPSRETSHKQWKRFRRAGRVDALSPG